MIKEKGWNIIMSTNEIMPKLKDFLCENLGIDADVLEFDTQLFGDGEIGLDSIDSLEIIAYVDDEFGVQMTGVGKDTSTALRQSLSISKKMHNIF